MKGGPEARVGLSPSSAAESMLELGGAAGGVGRSVSVPAPAQSSASSSSSVSAAAAGGSGAWARQGGGENFSPQVIQRLGREIQELFSSPPEGISYVPNDEESMAEVYVDICGPVGTPYEGGVFRAKLVLGREYPNAPPRAFFLTKIFHPNVSATGDICVNMLKRDWRVDVTLSHLLQVIRCLLIVPFPESSLNDEAGKLFMESYAEYARRARLLTQVHACHGDKKMPAAGPSSSSSTTTTTAASSSSSAASSGPVPMAVAPLNVNSADRGQAEMGASSKAVQQQREKKRKHLKRL